MQISGPTNDLARQVIPLNWVSLTDIKLDIGRGARDRTLKKAADAQGLEASWQNTGLYKRLQSQEKRENMTDFDRFKLKTAQRQRGVQVGKAYRALKSKK